MTPTTKIWTKALVHKREGYSDTSQRRAAIHMGGVLKVFPYPQESRVRGTTKMADSREAVPLHECIRPFRANRSVLVRKAPLSGMLRNEFGNNSQVVLAKPEASKF